MFALSGTSLFVSLSWLFREARRGGGRLFSCWEGEAVCLPLWVGGVGQEVDRIQLLAALHYLSWTVSVGGGKNFYSGQMSRSEFVDARKDAHPDVSQLLEIELKLIK